MNGRVGVKFESLPSAQTRELALSSRALQPRPPRPAATRPQPRVPPPRVQSVGEAPRMPPLFLLCGPSGVGKTTLARLLDEARPAQLARFSQDTYFGAPFVPYGEAVASGVAEIEAPHHIDWAALRAAVRSARQEGRACLVEGHNLLCDAALVEEASAIFFLDAPPSTCATRRVTRRERTPAEQAELRTYYERFVWAAHLQYVRPRMEELRAAGRLVVVDAARGMEALVEELLPRLDEEMARDGEEEGMTLRLSIGDVDSYSMLFYAHYLRFCERAANLCLPSDGGYAVLELAHIVKYSSSVRWNDKVVIRSRRIPPLDSTTSSGGSGTGTEETLLHEWICAGKSAPVHSCLATYRLHGAPSFTRAPATEQKDERRVRAMQRQAAETFTPDPKSYARERMAVFPDMCGAFGSLSLPTVLDLMERQRTELIGGQAELERLKQSDNIMVVVYEMQQLRLHGTAVKSVSPACFFLRAQ